MKIAVVGSGISGISAAINLHANFEIYLFEEMDKIGGHSNSVSVRDIDDKELIQWGYSRFGFSGENLDLS